MKYKKDNWNIKEPIDNPFMVNLLPIYQEYTQRNNGAPYWTLLEPVMILGC